MPHTTTTTHLAPGDLAAASVTIQPFTPSGADGPVPATSLHIDTLGLVFSHDLTPHEAASELRVLADRIDAADTDYQTRVTAAEAGETNAVAAWNATQAAVVAAARAVDPYAAGRAS